MKLLSVYLRLLCLSLLVLGQAAYGARTIVVDAGHGGHDRGGMPGQKIAEKGYALDVAQRVASKLKRAGFHTVMTRNGDYFVSLGQRCAMAKQYKNAVFVSIHFNSAANKDAYGIETYWSRGRDSAALASAIQKRVLSATGSIDRRVRNRGFYVLRNNRAPAVLCELGFLTNRYEAKKIGRSTYRQSLANAVAGAIIQKY